MRACSAPHELQHERGGVRPVLRVLQGHFATIRHARAHGGKAAKAGGSVCGRIVHGTEAGCWAAGQQQLRHGQGRDRAPLNIAREMGRYGVTSNFIAPRAYSQTLGTPGGEARGARRGLRRVAPRVAGVLRRLPREPRGGRDQRSGLRRLGKRGHALRGLAPGRDDPEGRRCVHPRRADRSPVRALRRPPARSEVAASLPRARRRSAAAAELAERLEHVRSTGGLVAEQQA